VVRDEAWKWVTQVGSPALVELIFQTVDSNMDQQLDRRELRFSPFGEALQPQWAELDADQDQHVSRQEFDAFFAGLARRLGSA
jgi:hypothetical protein